MSRFCFSHFFNKNISIYDIFNDQSFKDKLTNNIVSIEQLCPGYRFTEPDVRNTRSLQEASTDFTCSNRFRGS